MDWVGAFFILAILVIVFAGGMLVGSVLESRDHDLKRMKDDALARLEQNARKERENRYSRGNYSELAEKVSEFQKVKGAEDAS
jgi:hypothetical protein